MVISLSLYGISTQLLYLYMALSFTQILSLAMLQFDVLLIPLHISAYPLSKWKGISLNLPSSTTHPQRRRSSSFHYCDGLDRALLYGGYYDSRKSHDENEIIDESMVLSDTWLFEFPPSSQWTRIHPQTSEPALPKARAEHASIVLPSSFISVGDASYCHVVIHGGLTPNYESSGNYKFYLDDLWILSVSLSAPPFGTVNANQRNSSSLHGIFTFTKPVQDTANSPIPSARAGHGLLVVGSYLYLIGGYTTRFGTTTIQSDMYKLELTGNKQSDGKNYSFNAKWQKISFANGKGVPEFRARATYAADPSTNTIIMFGGEKSIGQVLSDVWIFDTINESWTKIIGYEVKNTLSAAVVYESNFIWYAGSYREVIDAKTTKTYVYRDSGLSAVAINKKGPRDREISFKCVDPTSKTEAMWCITGYDELSSPGARFGHSMIIRNGEMILFGGEFTDSFSDMWSISLPNVIALGKVYVPTTSQSTVYFAIATLTLLLVGFMILIIGIRRRSIAYHQSLLLLSRNQQIVESINGVSSNMIALLPTFSYSKGVKPDVAKLYADIGKEHERSSGKSSNSESFEKVNPQNSSINPILLSESKEIESSSSIAADICPICLAEFEDEEVLKVLPCSHFFHPSCIDKWLNGHNSCPMCKRCVVCDIQGDQAQSTPESQENQPSFIEMGTIQREFSIDMQPIHEQEPNESVSSSNIDSDSNRAPVAQTQGHNSTQIVLNV